VFIAPLYPSPEPKPDSRPAAVIVQSGHGIEGAGVHDAMMGRPAYQPVNVTGTNRRALFPLRRPLSLQTNLLPQQNCQSD
jgi:hypothetical protein